MTTEQQRAAFEKWAKGAYDLRRAQFEQDQYARESTQYAWSGWTAALAALPQGEPVSEHDAAIIKDLEVMAANKITGFWPPALAIGALRIIRSRTRPPSLAEAVERQNELQAILQDVFTFAGRLRNISKLHSDQLADYCQRKGYRPNFIRASAPGGQE